MARSIQKAKAKAKKMQPALEVQAFVPHKYQTADVRIDYGIAQTIITPFGLSNNTEGVTSVALYRTAANNCWYRTASELSTKYVAAKESVGRGQLKEWIIEVCSNNDKHLDAPAMIEIFYVARKEPTTEMVRKILSSMIPQLVTSETGDARVALLHFLSDYTANLAVRVQRSPIEIYLVNYAFTKEREFTQEMA